MRTYKITDTAKPRDWGEYKSWIRGVVLEVHNLGPTVRGFMSLKILNEVGETGWIFDDDASLCV